MRIRRTTGPGASPLSGSNGNSNENSAVSVTGITCVVCGGDR